MKIKNIISLFLLLAVSVSSNGQLIRDINTDEDVIRFMKDYSVKHDSHWDNIGFDLGKIYGILRTKDADKKLSDSISRTRWIRSDFNGDGYDDLIFNGVMGNYSKPVIYFISDGPDSVNVGYLGNTFYSMYPTSIKFIEKDCEKFLELGTVHKGNDCKTLNWDNWYNFQSDLLVYKFGGFIEYNPLSIQPVVFDSISYTPVSNWLMPDPSSLILYPDGRLKLTWHYFENKLCWDRVQPELTSNLYDLLGYIKFKGLERNYTLCGIMDIPTAYTTLYQKTNSYSITDYGMHGTFGLSLLYRIFDKILAVYNRANICPLAK